MPTLQTPGGVFEALTELDKGLQTEMPTGCTQLTAGGKVSQLTDLSTEVAGMLAIYQTVETTGLAHKNALKARDDAEPTVMARYQEIATAVKAALGKRSPNLPKLGLKTNKTPTPLTAAQKLERNAKAQATRKARGTKGKKQVRAMHGEVPTPAPQPSAPVVPPTPSPTATKPAA